MSALSLAVSSQRTGPQGFQNFQGQPQVLPPNTDIRTQARGPSTTASEPANTPDRTLRASTSQRDAFQCPDSFGFYPHHKSCDKYWACENGTATLKLCGNGLAFDDQDSLRENCAYPFSVDCGSRTDMGESRLYM